MSKATGRRTRQGHGRNGAAVAAVAEEQVMDSEESLAEEDASQPAAAQPALQQMTQSSTATTVSAMSDFTSSQAESGHTLTPQKRDNLVKTFVSQTLFHFKKYFFRPEEDFNPRKQMMKMIFKEAGWSPGALQSLGEDAVDKETKRLKVVVEKSLNSKRSTVVDNLKMKYVGK